MSEEKVVAQATKLGFWGWVGSVFSMLARLKVTFGWLAIVVFAYRASEYWDGLYPAKFTLFAVAFTVVFVPLVWIEGRMAGIAALVRSSIDNWNMFANMQQYKAIKGDYHRNKKNEVLLYSDFGNEMENLKRNVKIAEAAAKAAEEHVADLEKLCEQKAGLAELEQKIAASMKAHHEELGKLSSWKAELVEQVSGRTAAQLEQNRSSLVAVLRSQLQEWRTEQQAGPKPHVRDDVSTSTSGNTSRASQHHGSQPSSDTRDLSGSATTRMGYSDPVDPSAGFQDLSADSEHVVCQMCGNVPSNGWVLFSDHDKVAVCSGGTCLTKAAELGTYLAYEKFSTPNPQRDEALVGV